MVVLEACSCWYGLSSPTRLQPTGGVRGITSCIYVDFSGYLILAQVESCFSVVVLVLLAILV